MAQHLAVKFSCDTCWAQTDATPVGIVELDDSLLPPGWFKIHIAGGKDNVDVKLEVCGDCHDSMILGPGLDVRRTNIWGDRSAPKLTGI